MFLEKGRSALPPVNYSPESWKIDPAILSPKAQELWWAENQVPVEISEDNSLRPKILDACGMACVFCHNEGTPVAAVEKASGSHLHPSLGRVSIYASTNGVNFLPGRMRPDADLTTALGALRDRVGVSELHLTGGEPTLHPELPEIIALARGAGMNVKMTSNGENPRAFERCAEAGLNRVIFSIFGTDARSLSQVQHPKFQNEKLAQRKIDSLRRSIEQTAMHGISASANVVVPGPGHEGRIAGILDEFDSLSLRLLNSLDDGDGSFAAIYELLARLDATPTKLKVTAGSSNTRTDYQLPNGSEISFKQIRPARLDHICDGCEIDKQGKCEEGFYGLRLYVDEQGQYMVGVCIQRMDLVTHLDEFLAGDMPERIKAFREYERIAMEGYFNQPR